MWRKFKILKFSSQILCPFAEQSSLACSFAPTTFHTAGVDDFSSVYKIIEVIQVFQISKIDQIIFWLVPPCHATGTWPNLYINLTFGSFCLFPYSAFIIALKTTKLGMYCEQLTILADRSEASNK
jgi:hypothetical protein